MNPLLLLLVDKRLVLLTERDVNVNSVLDG